MGLFRNTDLHLSSMVEKRERTTDEVVKLLTSNQEFGFDLTGSRYYGYARPESDYDFFTEATNDGRLDAYLTGLGFSAGDFETYDGTGLNVNTVAIYQRDLVGQGVGPGIDVIVVKSGHLMRKVQQAFGNNQYLQDALKACPKPERTDLFNALYALLGLE